MKQLAVLLAIGIIFTAGCTQEETQIDPVTEDIIQNHQGPTQPPSSVGPPGPPPSN